MLGSYDKRYQDILIAKTKRADLGVLCPEAIELYFDYLSDNGTLARLVKENSDEDDMSLIRLLLEHAKAYGLSDVQARKLIADNRTNFTTTNH